MLGDSVFSDVVKGTCLFCQKAESIIRAIWADGVNTCDYGVCDVCAFALEHAWNRAMGRQVIATTPRFARSYVLVPRLMDKRPAVDISSYQFLVTTEGSLPWVEHDGSWDAIPDFVERWFGCKTWLETLKRCYLGFASGGDFSEVVVAWAWGRSLDVKESRQPRTWKTFAELLAVPSPDAGLHLGISSGFESLLWRKEVQPEDNELCVYLPPRTMKYLRYHELMEERVTGKASTENEASEEGEQDTKQPGGREQEIEDDAEAEDDLATIEFYKSAMSPAELAVVKILDDARRLREEEARKSAEDDSSEGASEVGEVGEDPNVEATTLRRPSIIPPGYARERVIVEK
jgi:hypothetical protein